MPIVLRKYLDFIHIFYLTDVKQVTGADISRLLGLLPAFNTAVHLSFAYCRKRFIAYLALLGVRPNVFPSITYL
jgi:hypothetical protein